MAPPSPQFDGFEEVALPDVEEEEEPPKIPTAPKNKRRKEIGAQNHDKVHQAVGDGPFFINQDLSFCLNLSLAKLPGSEAAVDMQSPWEEQCSC